MNATRRKTIAELQDQTSAAKEQLEALYQQFRDAVWMQPWEGGTIVAELATRIQGIKDTIARLRDELEDSKQEEEEAKENLPASMQDGTKADTMQDNIDAIERALAALDEANDALGEIQ